MRYTMSQREILLKLFEKGHLDIDDERYYAVDSDNAEMVVIQYWSEYDDCRKFLLSADSLEEAANELCEFAELLSGLREEYKEEEENEK